MVRNDAVNLAPRADEDTARTALIQHVCEKIAEFEQRFDALVARVNEAEDKRRANIPREYTDGNHDELAASWLAGFDGKELTTKQEGKSND